MDCTRDTDVDTTHATRGPGVLTRLLTWRATSARRRRLSGTDDNGERRGFAGGEWYWDVAQVIANLLDQLRVVKDDGDGRRRGSSGGGALGFVGRRLRWRSDDAKGLWR